MIKRFIQNRYRSYTPDGKFWLTVGAIALIVDMAIGYSAGAAQATFWHGVGGAGLALGFAFLPDAAYEEMEQKRFAPACLIALICIPIGVKAYEQQLTYTAGMRQGEMVGVNVVNARKENAKSNVKDNEALLKLLNSQLATLMEQDGWTATIKADALREELKTVQERMAAEERGQRGRKAGRGKEFEALQNKATELTTKIAKVEQREELTNRIAATKNALETARATDDKREHKTSLNMSVAETTAAMFNIVWGQSPEDAMKTTEASLRYATIGSAGLGSLALLLLAPVGFFLAGRRRIKEQHETEPSTLASPATALQIKPANTHTREIVRTDNQVWSDLRRALKAA
jgi:hypothetical protein